MRTGKPGNKTYIKAGIRASLHYRRIGLQG
jgi:hypothetical protein